MTTTATAAKRIEHRITRELVQRRQGAAEQEHITPLGRSVDRYWGRHRGSFDSG